MTETALALAPAPHRILATPSRPRRSAWWTVRRCFQGTWFLALIHVGAVAALWTSLDRVDWLLFAVLLPLRNLLTTAVQHRYFAHRSYKTSRTFQFVLACLCCANVQRGPIWWSAIHRQHHRHSDGPGDAHSPVAGGFLWAYAGWMIIPAEDPDWGTVRDLTRFPELVWLERLWVLPPLLLAGLCWLVGGWGGVCLGFCLSAVLVLHGTSIVNTYAHLHGFRRYPTPDASRNCPLLALFSFGDGWHNNHHHYPHSARAGFFWWEVDGAYTVIRLLGCVGLVWGIREVPPHKLHPPAGGGSPA